VLADQILHVVDHRIGYACEKLGLVYTRFVDDITISGPFNLDSRICGISKLVEGILRQHGVSPNPRKHRFGRFSDGFTITKIRIRNGRLDVRRQYFEEVVRQIEDAQSLARGDSFQGPYFTPAQIEGRVRFVCWINPGRKRQLLGKLKSIDWSRMQT